MNQSLDFETDVFDARSVLETFNNLIIKGKKLQIFLRGRIISSITEILADPRIPECGFKKDLLPGTIGGIYLDGNGDVALSYVARLNHSVEHQYWKGRGFSTRMDGESMQVIDTDGAVIARYGVNRVLINKEMLDTFLENMR